MRPYVLGFVGQNANGILRWWTEHVLEAFSPHGYDRKLIDLHDSAWPARLGEIMSTGAPQFCFSFQAMGMDVQINGENAWTRAGIPFFTCLSDSPYHAPRLHAAHAPGMFLLYGCVDFLDTYRRFLNGRAFAAFLPSIYPANPNASRTPWKQRRHEIIFAKTAANPAALREGWKKRPARLQTILQESAELVLSGIDDTVAGCCAAVFANRRIHWGEVREVFLSVCSSVDFYARAVRAERMVRALMRRNALIVGDWSYLDRTGSRAQFHAPVAASALDDLYADSRIVVNTLPAVRYGSHERVMAGLFARCAVVSDSTPWLDDTLSRCPSFFGLNIDAPSFEENLNDTAGSILADSSMEEKIEASAASASEIFSMENFASEILSYLELEKYRKADLGWWAFPPR
ncbi:MAG TPA: hypothetical protein VHC90_04920 [Bryobacteraceae bacterium]|nr:hypothetical protein [Bryobacteraceae bacterium]